MNKNIIKVGTAMGLLLLIGTFSNCKNSQKNEVKTPVATVIETSEIAEKKVVELSPRSPIVFIAGYDKGDNQFYNSARTYFKAKNYQIIEDAYSLEEILNWMNSNATKHPYGEVHIVNHSNPWRGMSLETVVKGERITAETLRKNITQGTLPVLKDVVTPETKVIFHSCGLGLNTELMNTLKDAFVGDEVPQVIASPYYNVFGGDFSAHYLAQPYYVFYPTAQSPGKTDLSKEIAKKYPKEKEIDWFEAITNERERYVGEPYYFQFNIPVQWEIDFQNSDTEIPSFESKEALMDWISENEELSLELLKFNIPVEKFRWNWKVKNSKLIIKGKTTVVCVLKPLIKPYGDLKHIEPDTNNKRLYAMK